MAYRIEFLPEAESEIRNELAYSKNHWGCGHATQYRKAIEAKIRHIARNPFLYAIKPEYGTGVRGIRYKGNWIFYRINEEREIISIIGFPSIYRFVRYSA